MAGPGVLSQQSWAQNPGLVLTGVFVNKSGSLTEPQSSSLFSGTNVTYFACNFNF